MLEFSSVLVEKGGFKGRLEKKCPISYVKAPLKEDVLGNILFLANIVFFYQDQENFKL